MRLPYDVFSDEGILESGFGEGFSALFFGAGHVADSPTALRGGAGRQRIRDLVAEGRDYIGVCAGAYLALLPEPKGLALARHELDHPQGGNIFQGFLNVDWPGMSAAPFPLWFQNGPVFSRGTDRVVARFAARQELDADRFSPEATFAVSDFAGRPAALESPFGEGRCVLVSPHLELGSLGIPGFNSLTTAWMQRNCPDEHRAHPNRVPIGRSRRRLLDDLGELGFADQVERPQWSTLKNLLTAPLGNAERRKDGA
ncbi:unnamed protein product [marine sediment metagenome]|uniref:Biotin-protein ligase N-terminal domain-containing protein n=1 Tax=marine sediment metagenome TaxID=412755 RepID=X1H8G6_9ZZZZ